MVSENTVRDSGHLIRPLIRKMKTESRQFEFFKPFWRN